MNMFKKNGGFTLVELIVVIAILAILAGVAVPAYSGYIKSANEAADMTALAAVKTAVMAANATEGTVVSITFTEGSGVTDVVLEDDEATAVEDNDKIEEYFGSDLAALVLETGSAASWSATADDESDIEAGWTITGE